MPAEVIGRRVTEIYEAAGLMQKTRNAFRYEQCALKWADGPAWQWSFRIAKTLGLDFTDLWEIDDGFDPVTCVPLSFDRRDGTGKRKKAPLMLATSRREAS